MSDEDLRELERRFRASGAPEDEAAWLSARVRAGGLARERVELAAWLEDPAALAVTGRVEAAPPLAATSLLPELPPAWRAGWLPPLELLCGIAGWGREACARALISLVRNGDDDDLVLLEAWLACPCDAHAILNQASADRFEALVRGGATHVNVRVTFCGAQRALAATSPEAWTRHAGEGLVALLLPGRTRELDMAPARTELVTWALGRGDPAAQRTDARVARVTRDLGSAHDVDDEAVRVAGLLGRLALPLVPRLEALAAGPIVGTRRSAALALERIAGRVGRPSEDELRQITQDAGEWR